MPPRRNKEEFQQLTEFERGRIIGLREGGFSYRAIGARVQRNSSTVMRVWKQWTDEHRTTRKSGSGGWKVTPARDDRHLLRMAIDDHTASSRQLSARGSTATGLLMSASSIRRRLLHCGLIARVPLYRILLTANHRRLRRQWAHEHRACQADWRQVVFSDESRFNLLGPSMMAAFVLDSMPVKAAFQSNLNSNRYVREVLQPEDVAFLQGIPGAIFHQDNARSHVAKTVRDFCSDQHIQLLPWPSYLPDMSPIELVWDLVSRRLARDSRPAALKDELLLRIQAIWNSLPQADIQNLFDSTPRCIAIFIEARGGYTKY
ncbi:transposable element Tc1 transposase [Trichonephila clavipes]|nr:transposable element Tc1 transposase [Trichonephila clavipes]